jgi:hypothetical protein
MSEINCFGDEYVYGEVVQGWTMVQLMNVPEGNNRGYLVNGFIMKEGSFGLTSSNDPTFVFDLEPMLDPNPNDEDDGSPDFSEDEKKYFEILRHYQRRLTGDVESGFDLVTSCAREGFNILEDGFTCWLMERMAQLYIKCGKKPIRIHKRVGSLP